MAPGPRILLVPGLHLHGGGMGASLRFVCDTGLTNVHVGDGQVHSFQVPRAAQQRKADHYHPCA